jgi:exopolysaccharide production protein ExoZ
VRRCRSDRARRPASLSVDDKTGVIPRRDALAIRRFLPSSPAAAVSTRTISGVQLLRAVAATAVVVTHVQYDFVHRLALPNSLPIWFGFLGAGVHLFFVISGFIMVYSSESLFGRSGAPSEFLLRRIARIVPLYWTVTTLMLGYDIIRGFAAADASVPLAIRSYFFIPYQRPSGEMGPLFGVGWTLDYEMFFYVIFAAAIFARRSVALSSIIGALLVFSIFHALSRRLSLPFSFWFDPIILEFALGMALGIVYQAGIRLPAATGLVLIAAAISGFFWQAYASHLPFPSWIGLGIPSVLAVSAFTLAKKPFAFPAINKLGDASYAIYLVHPMIIAMARMFAEHDYLRPADRPWLYLIGVVAVSIGTALIVHQCFERPIAVRCRRVLLSAPRRLATRRA